MTFQELIKIAERVNNWKLWQTVVQRTEFAKVPISEVITIAERVNDLDDYDVWGVVLDRIKNEVFTD